MPGRRTPSFALALAMLALIGCHPQATTPTARETVPTAIPGAASIALPAHERVVGNGFAVIHEEAVERMRPSTSEQAAIRIVLAEIEAGRAKEVPRRGVLPSMRVVEAVFSPALIDVINPWQGRSFEASSPVQAWIVVLDGVAPDGEYSALGIVDDVRGRALVVQVWLPGA